MAHGQRHSAIPEQIQQQIENCLQTLHAKTPPPPARRSLDGRGPSVPTTLDFSAPQVLQGALSCFGPRKSSALMLEWYPSCCCTIYSGCPGTNGTFLLPGLDGGRVVAMPGSEEVATARSSPPATLIPVMAPAKALILKIPIINVQF